MNDIKKDTQKERPFGAWLRIVDALLARRIDEALAAEDVTRKEWLVLTALGGENPNPGLLARLARKPHRLRSLADRGWIDTTEHPPTLTESGRIARDRIMAAVDGVRERVAGSIPAEDYDTLARSLHAIADELSDGEDLPDPADRRGRRGFGRAHGFGHWHGFPRGPRHEFADRVGDGCHGFGHGGGSRHEHHHDDAPFGRGHAGCRHDADERPAPHRG